MRTIFKILGLIVILPRIQMRSPQINDRFAGKRLVFNRLFFLSGCIMAKTLYKYKSKGYRTYAIEKAAVANKGLIEIMTFHKLLILRPTA